MTARRKLGDWGEEMACNFLLRRGFKIKERNYFSTVGEIDIVAEKGGDFYFIEVKTREDEQFANDTAITPSKKRKLDKTIRHFCYHRGIGDVGIITAGLIVHAKRAEKSVKFRLAVFI